MNVDETRKAYQAAREPYVRGLSFAASRDLMEPADAHIVALEAENAALRAALTAIANVEYGYDEMPDVARRALADADAGAQEAGTP